MTVNIDGITIDFDELLFGPNRGMLYDYSHYLEVEYPIVHQYDEMRYAVSPFVVECFTLFAPRSIEYLICVPLN